jgi:hypothetical protein
MSHYSNDLDLGPGALISKPLTPASRIKYALIAVLVVVNIVR